MDGLVVPANPEGKTRRQSRGRLVDVCLHRVVLGILLRRPQLGGLYLQWRPGVQHLSRGWLLLARQPAARTRCRVQIFWLWRQSGAHCCEGFSVYSGHISSNKQELTATMPNKPEREREDSQHHVVGPSATGRTTPALREPARCAAASAATPSQHVQRVKTGREPAKRQPTLGPNGPLPRCSTPQRCEPCFPDTTPQDPSCGSAAPANIAAEARPLPKARKLCKDIAAAGIHLSESALRISHLHLSV